MKRRKSDGPARCKVSSLPKKNPPAPFERLKCISRLPKQNENSKQIQFGLVSNSVLVANNIVNRLCDVGDVLLAHCAQCQLVFMSIRDWGSLQPLIDARPDLSR